MYYLKCLFPPYNTCQVTEIAEKVFLVARNKITEGRTDSEDRLAVLLDEFGVSARRLTDYNRRFYLFLFFLCLALSRQQKMKEF